MRISTLYRLLLHLPHCRTEGLRQCPLELDWGIEGEIFEVTNEDFQKNSMKIFGYAFDSPKMKGISDLFLGAKTLYAYRLNGGGEKASNDFATALYGGTRGNDLKIVIQANTDQPEKFDVLTYLGTVKVDAQSVIEMKELVANDYVTFKSDATLKVTVATPLSGGTNAEVSGTSHQTYLEKIESYTYNTMGVAVTDETTKKLYVSFNKRLRNEMGIKFQLVVYNLAADDVGVISIKNKVTDAGWSEAALVYWVTGAECGCAVNKSCQNKIYDGAFTVDANFTQNQLIQAIKDGEFVLHRVNSNIRVLEDINTMVTVTDTQGEIFKDNQTVRVIDQIGNDIAVLFSTKYLGVVPNDAAGRISLWSDIVAHHRELEKIRAIEDFSDEDVTVEEGDSKKSVVISDLVTVVNAMGKLYMTVTVS